MFIWSVESVTGWLHSPKVSIQLPQLRHAPVRPKALQPAPHLLAAAIHRGAHTGHLKHSRGAQRVQPRLRDGREVRIVAQEPRQLQDASGVDAGGVRAGRVARKAYEE